VRTVRVVPCLDVAAGRVVKGAKFLHLRDAGDPVELATRYDAEGADEVVFYDITASAQERNIMLDVVERTAETLFIPLTVGGGIRSVDDARRMLRAGADKVSLNSAAVKTPSIINEVSHEFGAQCAVLSIDVKRRESGSGWDVYLNGGRVNTEKDALTWVAEGVKRGAGELVLNSMDRDGMQNGYDVELLRAVADIAEVPLVASGGVGTLEHLVEGVRAGADAVLAASIFHFGTYSIAEAKAHLGSAGIPVRPVAGRGSAVRE
jgi:cyclase